ncbi:MAG: hypothetical protein WC455_30880 [Dehalococcoidia bacterium]|jgi:hypothetical protein
MILHNWLKRFRKDDGFSSMSAESWARICNVLETMEVLGGSLKKTQSGLGWLLDVTGRYSDLPYPEGVTPPGANTTPQPFDVRTAIDGSSMAVFVYVPAAEDQAVTRNGHPVASATAITAGWYALETVSASGTRYVWAIVTQASGGDEAWFAGEEGAEWSIAAGSSMPSLTVLARRQQTPVLIAVIVNGVVAQIRHGRLDTFYAAPDSENATPENKSLSHSVDGKGVLQIEGFDSLSARKSIEDIVGATIRDFILRFDLPSGTAGVAYADGEVVAGYILPQDTEIWGRVAYDTTYNKFVQYKDAWDVETRTFIEIPEQTPVDIIELESHSSQHA